MNNLEFAIKMQGRTMNFAVAVVKFFVKLLTNSLTILCG